MLKDTIANLAGSLVPLVFAILTVPIYLRLIGEERYGVLAVIWVLLGYFGVFDFGVGKAAARRMAQIECDKLRGDLFYTTIVLTLVLGLAGGLVLLLSSEWVLVHLFTLRDASREEALASVMWMPIALTLIMLNSAMQGALQARERFLAINFVGIFGDSLAQLLPLFVAWMGYVGIEFLLPTVLLARLATLILLFLQCKKHVPFRSKLNFDFSHIRPLLGYGGWASTLTMISPLMTVIDRLVIGAISGAKGVAVFTIPFNLVTKVSILPNSYAAVLFPKMAALSRGQSRELADESGRIVVAFMTPVVIAAIGLIHPFILLWLGRDLAGRAAGIGELILLGVWISAVCMPYTYFLYAEARLKAKILLISLLEIPLYFLLLWFGVMNFGVQGAAAAWTLRVLVDSFFMLSLASALKTARYSLVPMLLVLLSSFVVYFFDITEIWRWLGILVLVCLSIVIHRELCRNACRLLISRRV